MDLHRQCFVVLGALLSTFLLLYECRKLEGYDFHVYTTDFCPRNKTEWEARSSELNCPKDTSFSCFPNENLTMLLELCFPSANIPIQEGVCLYLTKDLKGLDDINCRHFAYGCPTTYYTGSTIYTFPSCTQVENGCFLADLSCKSVQTSTQNTVADLALILVPLGVLIMMIVIGCLLYIRYRPRGISRTQRANEDKEEGQELLTNQKDVYQEGNADKSIFELWEKEDECFISTRATKEVEEMIKTKNLVIVSGHTGSGKSAIIQHIALTYRKQGWVIKPVDEVREIKEFSNSSALKENKTMFVFNDPLGNLGLDVSMNSSWNSYESTLKSLLEKYKILMTCRKHILCEKVIGDLFKDSSSILDIEDEKYKLNFDEKKEIFKSHAKNENFTSETLEEIGRDKLCFPLQCKLFSEMRKSNPDKKLKFSVDPYDIISKQIEFFQQKETTKYCALVCLFRFDNKLSKYTLEKEKEKFQGCLKRCSISVPLSKIIQSLDALAGFFVKCTDGTYSFYHDFVMEVTTYLIGNDLLLATIDESNLNFLRKRVRTENIEKDRYSIIVNHKYINELVNRFCKGLFSNDFIEVILNPCLCDKNVTKILKNKIQKTSPRKLQQIIKKKSTSEKYYLRQDIGKNRDETNKEQWISQFDFVFQEYNISPLFALIAFGHDDLSRCFLMTLQNMKINLAGYNLFCALCCSGSMDLFNEFFSKSDLNDFLKERWGNMHPIHIASFYHNYKLLSKMLELDIDVNMEAINRITCYERTPLDMAIQAFKHRNSSNNADMLTKGIKTVDCLLKKGAELLFPFEGVSCPLYEACTIGNDTIFKPTFVTDKLDEYLLYVACQNGHTKIVEILLNTGVAVKLKPLGSPLHVACQNGYQDIVNLLLDKGVEVNLCSRHFETPLSVACRYGKEDIVKLLLKRKADVNKVLKLEKSFPYENGNAVDLRLDSIGGPLYAACEKGHVSIVKLLLDNGADVNFCLNYGLSPLYVASYIGNYDIVQHLLEHDANVNLCMSDGVNLYNVFFKEYITTIQITSDMNANNDIFNPLFAACYKGYASIVQLLVDHGADINKCGKNGTGLIFMDLRLELISRISSKEKDLIVMYDGTSSLYAACLSKDLRIVQFLVGKGADINARFKTQRRTGSLDSYSNITYCHYEFKTCQKTRSVFYDACRDGIEDIVHFLLNNDAKVNVSSKFDKNPLYAACKNGRENIVQLLLKKGADIKSCVKTPLYPACEKGLYGIVKLLLDKGVDINLCSEKKKTPLYAACENGHNSIVKLLLDNGVDINLRSEKRKTPLYAACEKGHNSIVRLLLDKGVDIDLCSKNTNVPLYAACENGHENVVKCLLDSGAEVNSCSGESPLIVACSYSHDDIVKQLLKKNAEINACFKNKRSPLEAACLHGNDKIVQLLLDKGADVNLYSLKSPLYEACYSGHQSTVKLLLEKGAAVNGSFGFQGRPLNIACYLGLHGIVQLLLDKGADINIGSEYEESPLFSACERTVEDYIQDIRFNDSTSDQLKTIQLLLDNGADINLISLKGKSPLYNACENGNYQIVDLLLKNGAKLNFFSEKNGSALFAACKNDHFHTIRLLLKKGAMVNAFSEHKGSPLYAACKEGNKFIVHLLLTKDAQVNAFSENKGSPLNAACYNGDEDIVKLLLDKGAEVNLNSGKVDSPLYMACYLKRYTIVQWLLERGAEVNSSLQHKTSIIYTLGKNKSIHYILDNAGSPLHAACMTGDENIVKLLLEKDSDVNFCMNGGPSPLYVASFNGHYDIVQLLLDYKADVNSCLSDGESSVSVVFFKGYGTNRKIIIKKNVKVNASDDTTFSPLFAACYKGHASIVQLLLKSGADINSCGKNGTGLFFMEPTYGVDLSTFLQFDGATPLYAACYNNHYRIVQLLLKYKADLNCYANYETSYEVVIYPIESNKEIQTNVFTLQGISPLLVACKKGSDEIVQFLLENSAEVNSEKITPLYVACANGFFNIVQLLLDRGAKIDTASNHGTPLYAACTNGQDNIVQLLLDRGAKIDVASDHGNALYAACANGHNNIVQLLLGRGAKVDINSDHGTPLYAACRNGNISIVGTLLNESADVKICSNRVGSPLHGACEYGDDTIVKILLDKGANVNLCSEQFKTPVYLASKKGHHKVVELLLEYGAEVRKYSDKGGNPLYAACKFGSKKIIQILLDKGAYVNKVLEHDKNPLHAACKIDHHVVQLLIQRGAEVNSCSDKVGSPLYAACKYGCTKSILELINRGADVNFCSKDLGSPLHALCEEGRYHMIRVLLDRGADVNKCLDHVGSPLHVACKKKRHVESVQILLERNANVNIFTEKVGTPLHTACDNGNIKIVYILLDSGAKINLISKYVGSPLYMACKNGYKKIIQLLLDKGADINLCRNDETSPLHIAFQNGHDAIVQLLLKKGAELNKSLIDVAHPLFAEYQKRGECTS